MNQLKKMTKVIATDIGKEGEKAASSFLEKKGYSILTTNYRVRKSEVDIIAKQGDTVVFVEVKKRRNTHYGMPESFVSESQQERIQRAAEHYQEEENWNGEIRFDIIAIEKNDIHHFEDAF